MKELSAIARAFEQVRSAGTATALATVVEVNGSAYRRPGARMLITEAGQTTGGVSGGCLEQDVVRRARQVIQTGQAALVTYDTTDDDDIQFGVGLGCRGVVRVFIEPLPRADEPSYLAPVEELLQRREPGVLATVWRADDPPGVRAGSRLLLSTDGRLWDDISDPELGRRIEADAREALRTGRSAGHTYRLSAGMAEIFLEFLRSPVPLVVFGGGPDAVPLVQFAWELGWHVTVVDGRPSAASRARFPHAHAVLLCRPEEVHRHVQLCADTVAVVMTHNYLTDLRLLELLLPSPVRYLGLLGPKSRSERLLQELAEGGMVPTPAQRQRLYAPVGLDLGAESSEEIALAILGEIRTVLAGRAGGPLRDRPVPIHERERVEEPRLWEPSSGTERLVCPTSAS